MLFMGYVPGQQAAVLPLTVHLICMGWWQQWQARGGRPPGGTAAGLTYTVHQPHAAPEPRPGRREAEIPGTLRGARCRWPLPFTSLPSYAAALLPDVVCG